MVVRPFIVSLVALSSLSLIGCPGTKPPPVTPTDEVCDNGTDDDANGKSDCADPVCFRNALCTTAVEICGNGLDDDGNTLTDCADSACASETACAAKAEICEGGVDEDLDTKIDCADSDCTASLACRKKEICNNNIDDNGDPQIDCNDATCNGSPFCPSAESGKCANAVDDDADLAVDCQDADCAADSACGTTENTDTLCSNGLDDDSDFLVDCADGSCLSTLYCRTETKCADQLDNDKDGKTDCADSDCAVTFDCQGLSENCTDSIDNDNDTLVDCADLDCDAKACGTACLCGNSVASETDCSDGVDNDKDGNQDCLDITDCFSKPICNGGSAEANKCDDSQDNDNDTLIDCADTADCPNNAVCGAGCVCNAGAGKETACGDTIDNDRDTKVDCQDPDCATTTVETCDNNADDDCDGAIDCADTNCATLPVCTVLQDGKACSGDSQCAGGKCLSEAATGTPGGACSNAVSCNVTAQTGCFGARCVESGAFDICRPGCTGQGTGTTGACRAGFACFDPDTSTTNGNSYCKPLCTSDTQCVGMGTNYGCNTWSKLCEVKDKAKAKYGGPCTANGDCESGKCAVADPANDDNPGGYCYGECNATLKSCGGDGFCYYNTAWGDNVGICYDGCTASSGQCRTAERYSCQNPGIGGNVCWCRGLDVSCSSGGQCCTGLCDTDFFFGTFTCY